MSVIETALIRPPYTSGGQIYVDHIFNAFDDIVAIDFEFGQDENLQPKVHCLVAQHIRTGLCERWWIDELGGDPPFLVTPQTLVIAFYGTAELSCFQQLGWSPPACLIDLYAEARVHANGPHRPSAGLLDVAKRLHIPVVDEQYKEEMRDLALLNTTFTPEERKRLLDYCESDVRALSAIFLAATNTHKWFDTPERLAHALFRGDATKAITDVEMHGIPLDVETLMKLKSDWPKIREAFIERVNSDFGVYEGTTFKVDKFEAYLRAHQIKNWPRLDSGQRALDNQTFKQMCRHYPQMEPLHALRRTLAEVRAIKVTVGADGYNRFLASPFGTITGRNTSSTTKNIFGGPRWMRALITPPENEGLAYIDWAQQEVGIAAALSGDQAMQAAYNSGDCYLAFAEAAGAIPVGASPEARKKIRAMYKEAQLAINYQMTSFGLQHTLNVSRYEAQSLIDQHKRIFRSFWQWQDRVSAHAFGYGSLSTVYGWKMQVGSDTKPRTVANFPMQANGAELLRLALVYGRDAGVEIAATIHDAVLIQAPIVELQAQTALMQECMERASIELLEGFALRSDVHLVTFPDSLYERTGPLWEAFDGYLQNRCA